MVRQMLRKVRVIEAGDTNPREARHPRGRRPARRRQQPPGPPRGLHPVRLQAAGLDRPLAQAPAQAAHRRRVAVPAQRRRVANHFEAGGFIRSNDRVDYPNLMFHFLPIAIRYDGSRPAAEHGYQVHIGPMYSDVRGT